MFSGTRHKHLFLLLGRKHELWTDVLVEFLLAQSFELHGTLLKRRALLVRVLGDLAGHVVTDDGVEAGDKHQTRKLLVEDHNVLI